MDSVPPPRRALLIGCDFYFTGKERSVSYPSLSGCVEDVKAVKSFLTGINVPEDNIRTLTATCDPSHPDRPIEESTKWPTYENIIEAFDEIEEEFRKDFEKSASEEGTGSEKDTGVGGLLYIHYSGHGVRRSTLPACRNQDGGDDLHGTALAMTDVATGRAYLTGYQLGARIQGIVSGLEKPIRVTLILDSCFSGGGLRAPGIRTIDEKDTVELPADEQADQAANDYLSGLYGTRQVAFSQSWLSNPVGCTVITACGIDQAAREERFPEATQQGDAQAMRGALTWWILDLLNGIEKPGDRLPTHKAVRDHASKRLGNSLQTPTLYGQGNFEFFGLKEYMERPVSLVTKTSDGSLRLGVGSVQGVAKDAIYDIYPPHRDPRQGKFFDLAKEVRVSQANAFNSILLKESAKDICNGSFAVLRSWALSADMSVSLTPESVQKNKLRVLLGELLRQTPRLTLCEPEDDEATFVVMTDTSGDFQIWENGTRLERIPVISATHESAIPCLAYVLRHLGRYRDMWNLFDHPRLPQMSSTFKVSAEGDNFEQSTVDGVERFTVVEGQTLCLRFNYTGPDSHIRAHAYEFSPSWGITKKPTVSVLPGIPGHPISIKTSLPPKARADDPDRGIDRIMVFLCHSEEYSWDEIALPGLPTKQSLLPKSELSGVSVPGGKRGEWIVEDSPRWGLYAFEIHTMPQGSNIRGA